MSLSPVKDLVPYTHKTKQFASCTSLLLYAWNLPNLVQKSDIQKRSLNGLFSSTMRCIKSLKKICNLNELSDILRCGYDGRVYEGLACVKNELIIPTVWQSTFESMVEVYVYRQWWCILRLSMSSSAFIGWQSVHGVDDNVKIKNQNKERSLWRPGIPGNTLYFVEDTKRYRIFSEFSLWCTPRPRLHMYA